MWENYDNPVRDNVKVEDVFYEDEDEDEETKAT